MRAGFPVGLALMRSLERNRKKTEPASVPRSYVATSIAGNNGRIVLVVYGDYWRLNRVSDEATLESLVAMCRGYCRLIDNLQKSYRSRLCDQSRIMTSALQTIMSRTPPFTRTCRNL